METTTMISACRCYFCINGLEHRASHTNYSRISDELLVAESLNPQDSIKMEACTTCGHKQPVGANRST